MEGRQQASCSVCKTNLGIGYFLPAVSLACQRCGMLQGGHASGTDLASATALNPWTVCEAVSKLKEIAILARYSHRVGVVHGHLIPGLVRLNAGDGVAVYHTGCRFSGEVLGSVASFSVNVELDFAPYLAPEAILGGTTLDFSADVFSLGAMLCFMLGATTANKYCNVAERLWHQTRKPLLSVDEIGVAVSSELRAVLSSALAVEKSKRPQTLDQLLLLLDNVVD
jgi:serine/threonine protein kinase